VPLTPVALRVIAVPTQSGFGDALTLVIVGNAFTTTAPVTAVALVQPVPGYDTVKLYTPPAAVVVAVNDGATLVEL
jgi:hypothetical protein